MRKRVGPLGVGNVKRNPTSGSTDEIEARPLMSSGRGSMGGPLKQFEGEGGEVIAVPKSPGSSVGVCGSLPPPPRSVQLSPSPFLFAQLPPPAGR